MRKLISLMIVLFLAGTIVAQKKAPVLKVGYAGHDHQTALYVACLESERTKKDIGVYLKEMNPKKHYEMYKGEKKIADVEIFLSQGGSVIPTNMANGTFEIGFGGVAAFAFFIDKGTPMKIISPLHINGDMLVVKPDNPATSWESFVKWVKEQKKPVKIGYKAPVAVAKIIFERALKEEGITFTGDASDKDKNVLMVDMKGAPNIIPGLQNNIIDGFACNNPVCAIAGHKGIGKTIADLNDVPPGIFKDHPCCAIAATEAALKEKREIVKEFMKLIILATNYMNKEQEAVTVKHASTWLGTPLEVEKVSVPTSGYSTKPSEEWKKGMYVWVDAMHDLNKFQNKMKGKKGKDVEPILFDFTLLNTASNELKKKGVKEWY